MKRLPNLDVAGRSVAVIGRAATLNGSGLGSDIDAHDVVIRVNHVQASVEHDGGSRTDMVYRANLASEVQVEAQWRSVPDLAVDNDYRESVALSVVPDGSYRPYTGTMAVLAALDDGAARVAAYGMDLHRGPYADGSWAGGSGPAVEWSHVPVFDAVLLRAAMQDGRFVPGRALEAVLSAPMIYTAGVFDLLHHGHLNILERSAALGAYLIVGVLSDAGTMAYKNVRPAHEQDVRLRLIRALRCVSGAVLQHTTDPSQALRRFRPDVMTHGDDWARLRKGHGTLEELGVEWTLLPYTEGVSSTALREVVA